MMMVANPSSPKSRIVLAVDDVAQNLALIEQVVQQTGYSFIGVSGGVECLNVVSRVVPRLILLDIQMPGIDGFETCRRLREIHALDRTPIVFLTASKTIEAVRAGMRVGGNDFILKPFAVDQLHVRIQHWVTRGGLTMRADAVRHDTALPKADLRLT